MLETLITVIHIGVALFMVLVVLVQGGNQGGVGAAFGGGNSSGVFGATGATTLLGKLTYGAAFVFMLTSISLTIMQGRGGDIGLTDRLKEATPATQTTPSADMTPPPAAQAPAATPAAETPATPAPDQPAAPATGDK